MGGWGNVRSVGMVVMVVTWVCVSVGMCEGWNGMGEYKGGKKVVG